MEYYCNIYCHPRHDYFLKVHQLFENENNDGKGVYNFTGPDSYICVSNIGMHALAIILEKNFVFFVRKYIVRILKSKCLAIFC